MTFRLRLIIEWLIIAILANLTVIGLAYWDATSSFDNLLYDGISDIARPPADDDILIIAIDEPSLAQNGKWPWDRSLHAKLVNQLKALNPRSISLDIILSDKGPADSDKALAQALHGGGGQGQPAIFMPLHSVTPGEDGKDYDVILPHAAFTKSNDNIGHVNLTFDDDGVLRRFNICFQTDQNAKLWPHLMERIYQNRHEKSSAIMQKAMQDKQCNISALIPYSQRDSITQISYIEAQKGNIPRAFVAGKDVIIGATANGLGDNYPTPSSDGGLLSGVEIMANMLGALERDDFITPIPLWQSIIILLIPIWLLLLSFLRLQPRQILMVTAVIFFGLFALCVALLYFRYWLAPGPAIAALFLAYPLWGWRRLQTISYYMGAKLKELEAEEDSIPLNPRKNKSIDLIGRQRETLDQAIDNIRDLRRFVTDTLSGLPDPMFVSNLDDEVILSNDILDSRLETSLVGRSLSDAIDVLVSEQDRPAVRGYLDQNARHKNHTVLDREKVVRMDDTETNSMGFVRFSSKPNGNFVMRRTQLLSDEGELRGYIHYLADISALARADAQREEMLQLLSHDMRAPQSAILALLDGKIDDQAKKSIAINSKRTLQLAQDFVEIARMGETPFDGEDVMVDNLIDDVIDSLWPLANEKDVKLTLTNAGDGSFIVGEMDSLSRAFMNLLDNAIKFSPNASEIRVKIRHMDFGKAPMVCITIEDQGPGIAEDMLPKLFDRFTSNCGKEGRAQGTGLGLSFVSAVINRHNGSISADNKRDGGAIFSILIPESVIE